MASALYGKQVAGKHAGDWTLCHAKDPAVCPYHSEHKEMSAEQADQLNESTIAHRSLNVRKTPSTKREHHRIRNAMVTLVALASISSIASFAYSATKQPTASDMIAASGNYSEAQTQAIDGSDLRTDLKNKAEEKAQQLKGKADDYLSQHKGGKEDPSDSQADTATSNQDKLDSAQQKWSETKNKIKSSIDDMLSDYAANGPSSDMGSTSGSAAFGDVSRAQALDQLSKLKVETASPVDYDRGEWKTWDSVGRSCWNVREQTIVNQADNVQLAPDGCSITSITMTEPYENKSISNPKSVDIDHVVPLGYVARHGGNSWTEQQKEAYANDQTVGHLIAADSSANRSKSDKGPSEWMPDYNQCAYAEDFVNVLSRYSLSVDPSDASYLHDKIASCPVQ